jgi:hypothetical protein
MQIDHPVRIYTHAQGVCNMHIRSRNRTYIDVYTSKTKSHLPSSTIPRTVTVTRLLRGSGDWDMNMEPGLGTRRVASTHGRDSPVTNYTASPQLPSPNIQRGSTLEKKVNDADAGADGARGPPGSAAHDLSRKRLARMRRMYRLGDGNRVSWVLPR